MQNWISKFVFALSRCALFVLSVSVAAASVEETAFTYQARLSDNGHLADGAYDLRFTLFDAIDGITAFGSVTNAPTSVTNGLFTATLDFGSSVFNGGPRWLEIAVRTNGSSAAYTTLSPRQLVSATPYAIHAVNAATAATAASASAFSGAVADTQLSANVPRLNAPATFTGNVAAKTFVGSGAGLTDVNALTLAGLSAGDFWKIGGNSGTAGAHFLGASDNQPLELQTGGARAFRLEPDTNNFGAPNVIGGSPANFVDAGVYGATIAGGGVVNYGSNYFMPGLASNRVSAIWGTIAGGRGQHVAADHSFIGGGYNNYVEPIAYDSVIGGGARNTIQSSALGSVVGGGYGNVVQTNASNSVIGGGSGNTAHGYQSTVGGGSANSATAWASTVGGGEFNVATGQDSVVGGGLNNSASGSGATVPGGSKNVASGSTSFAAGNQAQASHDGSFVWSDASGAISSTAPNQFVARASGGFRFDGNVALEGGYRRMEMSGGNSIGYFYGSYPALGDGIHLAYNQYYDASGASHVVNAGGGSSRVTVGYSFVGLYVGGVNAAPLTQRLVATTSGVTVNGTFNNSSDRNAKQDFTAVNSLEILEKVVQLPLSEWSYKEDPATRHIGPMGQDFYSTFAIGTDERHLAPIDEGGVALAAIQGLNHKIEAQNAELKLKDAEITDLKARLTKLEQLVTERQGSAK